LPRDWAVYIWLAGYWFGWVLAFPGCALAVQAVVQDPDDTLCHTLFRVFVVLVLTGIPCITWGWIDPRVLASTEEGAMAAYAFE
jgi:hypothetical protein